MRVALSYYFFGTTMTKTIISAELVNGTQRIHQISALFGINFPLRLEPTVYAMAGRLAPNYTGGYWNLYTLTNQGFYMAPANAGPFHVVSMNGFEGQLSADALGIAACLFAYSHLSFDEGDFAELMAEHFHRLRDFALAHSEAGNILAVID